MQLGIFVLGEKMLICWTVNFSRVHNPLTSSANRPLALTVKVLEVVNPCVLVYLAGPLIIGYA